MPFIRIDAGALDVRHIHSWLNDLRVPVKIAQERLGHASISTTLKVVDFVKFRIGGAARG